MTPPQRRLVTRYFRLSTILLRGRAIWRCAEYVYAPTLHAAGTLFVQFPAIADAHSKTYLFHTETRGYAETSELALTRRCIYLNDEGKHRCEFAPFIASLCFTLPWSVSSISVYYINQGKDFDVLNSIFQSFVGGGKRWKADGKLPSTCAAYIKHSQLATLCAAFIRTE